MLSRGGQLIVGTGQLGYEVLFNTQNFQRKLAKQSKILSRERFTMDKKTYPEDSHITKYRIHYHYSKRTKMTSIVFRSWGIVEGTAAYDLFAKSQDPVSIAQ